MSNISEFESYWDRFTDRLRGTLMNESKKQTISYSVASILLSDALMSWSLSYDDCGAWLLRLKSEDPRKGELVSRILSNDIKFTEIEPKKVMPPAAKVLAPAAGAALGFGISHALGAGILVQIISTVLPAALIYPATNSVGNMMAENNKSAIIDDYMAQLDKYKKSVISVLSDY